MNQDQVYFITITPTLFSLTLIWSLFVNLIKNYSAIYSNGSGYWNRQQKISTILQDFQFGYRNYHSTIEQIQRVVTIIEILLEENKFCSVIFLDILQAFDRILHQGLKYKLSCILWKTSVVCLNRKLIIDNFAYYTRTKHPNFTNSMSEFRKEVFLNLSCFHSRYSKLWTHWKSYI